MTSRVMTVESLCVRRGSRDVLQHVSLELPAGEVLGVLGPNGAGKSSFLGACCAELPISEGLVCFGAVRAHKAKPLSLARTRAVLPQHPGMAFDLPVQEVVAMGAYPFPEMTVGQVEMAIEQAMLMTDLAAKAQEPYRALSGGEQQRTQFARVLVQTLAIVQAQGHAYLFLDEPTASLDPRHQVLLMEVVCRLARLHQTAVMVVMHDLNMAARWCDRLMLLANGRIAALDTPANVLTEPLLEQVYGLPMLVRPHPDHAQRLIVMVDG